jgi:predicted metal-dependent peptidase
VTTDYNLSPAELVNGARWHATKKVPYFTRGLLAMTFIPCPEVATAGIDSKWRVRYNPAYYAKCAVDGTLVGEVIHELLHPMLKHAKRERTIGATDHSHWNDCADAELDQKIEAMKVKLVTNRITPDMLGGEEGMTAEELYRLPRKGEGKKRCGGGSGVSGKPGEGEPAPGSGNGSGPPGLSPAEADLVAAAVALDVQNYAKQHGLGSVPLGILRWAEALLEPTPVDWHMLVASRIRYQIESKRGPTPSYSRPSRRRIGGLLLPVHRLPVAHVALVIDTSASMGTERDLPIALGVTLDACEALGKVTVVPCDAQAFEPTEVRCLEDLRPFLLGGGGTSMTAGIRAAADLDPDAIVVVTDGETGWPEEPPGIPVTIVLTKKSSYTPPAWADVVRAFE